MKFVTYNIQYGLGKDNRYDLARIAREVENADVICLQEVERHWQRSGCVDAPAVLGSHLPEHHWVYGANLDMDASYRDPALTCRPFARILGSSADLKPMLCVMQRRSLRALNKCR